VLTAKDGYEALEAMLSTPVNLVVLDMKMPRIDGHRVLRRMQQDPKLARIPIMVMAGDVRDVPANLVTLRKPFDDVKLVNTVEAIIGPPYRRPSWTPPLGTIAAMVDEAVSATQRKPT
jgi:twitching motility two-component system response regulator PilH